jgi:hypothetical protein
LGAERIGKPDFEVRALFDLAVQSVPPQCAESVVE